MAIIPGKNDVLFGKGTSINNHHGNVYVRKAVELQKARFLQTKREKKKDIAIAIVDEVYKLGGRFLTEDPNRDRKSKNNKCGSNKNKPDLLPTSNACVSSSPDDENRPVADPSILDKVWTEVDKERAIDKVMHRLREKKKRTGEKQPKSKGPKDGGMVKGANNNDHSPHVEPGSNDVLNSTPSSFTFNTNTSINQQLQPAPDLQVSSNNLLQQIQGLNYRPSVGGLPLDPPQTSIASRPTMNVFGQAPFQPSAPPRPDANRLPIATTLQTSNTAQSILGSLLQASLQASIPPRPDVNSLPQAQLQASILGRSCGNRNSLAQGAVQPSIISTLHQLAGPVPIMQGFNQTSVSNPVSKPAELGDQQQSKPSVTATSTMGSSESASKDKLTSHPLSIYQWISAAAQLYLNPVDYLQDAIDVSLLITKKLLQLWKAGEINAHDICIEKICIEKMRIHVDPLSIMQPGSRLLIKDVVFQPLVLPVLSMAQNLDNSTQRCSRGACSALGNILLEIFTKGRAGGLPGVTASADQRDYLGAPQAQRRRLNVPARTHFRSTVQHLFAEAGMPMTVCHMVCDLIDSITESGSDSAFSSLEELYRDLSMMRDDPQHFLFDRTCPRKAFEDTGLFQTTNRQIFGREKEVSLLMETKKHIADHVQQDLGDRMHSEDSKIGSLSFDVDVESRIEAVFLSGYAGSGKTELMNSLKRSCIADGWIVMNFNFDKQIPQMKVLAQGVNELFGTWASAILDPDMKMTVERVCRSISSTIDHEGLGQLCEIIPNLAKVIPDMASLAQSHCLDQGTTSSIERVGSAHERRKNLFHVLFKSICAAGRPVLLAYDDLQWAKSMEGMKEFLINYLSVPCAIQKGSCHHGLFLLGSFRSNEVNQDHGIIKTISEVEQSKKVKVSGLVIGGLEQGDITKLLSATLCLPFRCTRGLAGLVFKKTGGNPFYLVNFLKSIIQNNMLEFSVQSRRWIWDLEAIEMQMISEGVAELLTTRFSQLPDRLTRTLKIASCFGSQVNSSVIDILNSEQSIPFSMQDALKMAMSEGLVEKAGPIYQFTHGIIRQTVYDSIPTENRKRLHKTIGESLLGSARNNPPIHLLAVDQINIFCEDGTPTTEDRALYAKINATAAKYAIAASEFEQARYYVNVGLKMLDANNWQNQYKLSLELYEMSASVSCINGDIADMQTCLSAIIPNVQSFEDSLTSSALLTKLLAASSKYGEAIGNCLSVLSNLGEYFSQDVDLPTVLSELAVIQSTLANISVDQVRLLPPMTDISKLQAMRFLSLLCAFCIQSKPFLVPILACRMVRLTIEFGFCDDSIVGLVTAGYGLFSFTDDVELGYSIGKVGEALIDRNPNRHALRSRLVFELDSTLKAVVEPMQAAVGECPDRFNSATLAGDTTSASHSLLAHCIGSLHIGTNLTTLSSMFVNCIKQSTKYQQNFVTFLGSSSFGLCIYLSGSSDAGVDLMGYDRLNEIGQREGILNLLHQNFFNEMAGYFWMREYTKVVELTEKFKPTGHKRILEIMRTFFEGIACLNLARQTHQPHWRKIGEEALEKMLKWEIISKWNFECMAKLLQAELHYLNGHLKLAKLSYKASILSAQNHKFLHYEALALELYGIFCLETQAVDKGVDQLHFALAKYKEWGAKRKVKEVQEFIDLVDPEYLRNKMKIDI